MENLAVCGLCDQRHLLVTLALEDPCLPLNELEPLLMPLSLLHLWLFLSLLSLDSSSCLKLLSASENENDLWE